MTCRDDPATWDQVQACIAAGRTLEDFLPEFRPTKRPTNNAETAVVQYVAKASPQTATRNGYTSGGAVLKDSFCPLKLKEPARYLQGEEALGRWIFVSWLRRTFSQPEWPSTQLPLQPFHLEAARELSIAGWCCIWGDACGVHLEVALPLHPPPALPSLSDWLVLLEAVSSSALAGFILCHAVPAMCRSINGAKQQDVRQLIRQCLTLIHASEATPAQLQALADAVCPTDESPVGMLIRAELLLQCFAQHNICICPSVASMQADV